MVKEQFRETDVAQKMWVYEKKERRKQRATRISF